jgi:hypothetical protein
MGSTIGSNYDYPNPNQMDLIHDSKKVHLQTSHNSSNEVVINENVTNLKPIKNNKVSYWLVMDEFDENTVKEYLGENCFQNESQVDIILLAREFNNPLMLSNKHWAWLFKFKQHSTYRYATVEFANKGIMMGIYEDELKLSDFDICSTIVGDSNRIVYTKEFKTERKWGEILDKVTKMRETYPAKSYSFVYYNCRAFARELGRFLTPEFAKSQYNFRFDKSFPEFIYANSSHDWSDANK